VYGIGLNEIFEHRDNIVEKVRERLDIMEKNSAELDVMVCIYPPDEHEWMESAPDRAGELLDVLKQYAGKTGARFISDKNIISDVLGNCDGYYGSHTPYAHYLNMKNIPVMMSEYEL
jgi:hypothetical protein